MTGLVRSWATEPDEGCKEQEIGHAYVFLQPGNYALNLAIDLQHWNNFSLPQGG